MDTDHDKPHSSCRHLGKSYMTLISKLALIYFSRKFHCSILIVKCIFVPQLIGKWPSSWNLFWYDLHPSTDYQLDLVPESGTPPSKPILRTRTQSSVVAPVFSNMASSSPCQEVHVAGSLRQGWRGQRRDLSGSMTPTMSSSRLVGMTSHRFPVLPTTPPTLSHRPSSIFLLAWRFWQSHIQRWPRSSLVHVHYKGTWATPPLLLLSHLSSFVPLLRYFDVLLFRVALGLEEQDTTMEAINSGNHCRRQK